MLPIAYYLLKVLICSGILFGYYWLLLRNKVFHKYNRFYLMASVLLSLLMPLIKINFWQPHSLQQTGVIKVLQVVSTSDEYMDNIIVSAKNNPFDYQQLYPFGYLLVSLIFLIIFLHTLYRIFSLLKKYPKQTIDKISLVNTDAQSTPFSFLNYIFWNNNIDIETSTGNKIFKHELAHVEEKHTYDKLFINVILIFFWYNPFYWLYRKELNMIHEFIADKKAVEDSDTAVFAAMILQATYPQHRFQLTNNFFYSSIKRRLLMLTKNKNPKVNYFGRVMVLPLALLIFAAFTFKAITGKPDYNGKKIVVVIDAGHGGTDAGAKSIKGILEKDLTLALALKVKELNTNDKIDVVLTREEDKFQSIDEKISFIKNNNADLFISIHIDNSPAPTTKTGVKFFISPNGMENTEKSKSLAIVLVDEFSHSYPLTLLNSIVQPKNNIRILKAANIPSVLFEVGFMSNEKEVNYLQTDEAKEVIAKNLLAAIEKFATTNLQNKNLNEKALNTDKIPLNTYVNVKYADTNYLKTDDFKRKALVIIDAMEIGNMGYNYVEASTAVYSSVVIYNITEAKKIYGEKGKYGVIKLTQKNAIFISADSVFADEKNATIKLSGNKTTINGDLSNSLIYIDGKIATPAELNAIPPAKISAVNILKGDMLDEITDSKGKKSVINVSLKPDVLAEVVVTNNPKNNIEVQQAAVALDKMNVLYIGVDNPITAAAPNINPIDLKLTISQGSISGSNGKYIARVNTTGEAIISLFKKGNNNALQTFNFRVKRLPEPVNGKLPIDMDINYKVEPKFSVGNLTGVRVDANEFKKQTEIKVTEGYSFASADVYFSGEGFKNVIMAHLSGSSLSSLRQYTERCVAGSVVTFNNVYLSNSNGERKIIAGKSYSLFSYSKDDESIIFTKAEVEPSFQGGNDEWRKFLMKNLKPLTPVEEGWKAGKYTVIVKFIVHTDGTVSDVTTENYKGSKTALHCIEAIENAPKWQPALQNGRKVNAYKKQPITFLIAE